MKNAEHVDRAEAAARLSRMDSSPRAANAVIDHNNPVDKVRNRFNSSADQFFLIVGGDNRSHNHILVHILSGNLVLS